jgi:predicted metal-dependent hydrolase
MRELVINNHAIPCKVRKGAKGRTALKLHNGILHITTETGELKDYDNDFIKKKEGWILKRFFNELGLESQKKNFENMLPDSVLWEGEVVRVIWEIGNKNTYFFSNSVFRITTKKALSSSEKKRVLKEVYRLEAKPTLTAKLYAIANRLNAKVNKVAVKDQKSKWGSCSSKKNINLNWRLIFLPKELIEYVIYHELMHLYEPNHSQRFWELVARHVPNYNKLDKQLNDYKWVIGVLD